MARARRLAFGERATRVTPGATFGGYFLEERLDGGGDFAFFLATRTATGRSPFRGSGERFVLLMASEEVARNRWPPWADPSLARVLSHPNIVRMLDEGTRDGLRYFVFEHVDGVDLRSLLESGPLPRDVVLHRGGVAHAVVLALCAASESVGLDGSPFCYSHEAICPRWVFVSRSGAVKLGGFGFGFLKPEAPRRPEQVFATPGSWLGAPEEGRRIDLYQVGLLIHRMLHGTDFVSQARARILKAANGLDIAPTVFSGADAPLEDLLRGFLAERPEDRFGSISLARSALESMTPKVATASILPTTWLANRVERLVR